MFDLILLVVPLGVHFGFGFGLNVSLDQMMLHWEGIFGTLVVDNRPIPS